MNVFQPNKFLCQIDLVVITKVLDIGAFGGSFGFVYYVAATFMKANAVQATETIFKAIFCHLVAIAPATAKAMREIIGGTAAGDLPAVPVGFPWDN
ncbi:hypothetical protein [Pantoea ananatis]|uniref:hypothetical protein n=1 Tax=Pantoea ananas TaxID=553 RepID=UPI001B306A60|nr:hypothetical protein [Pantoea ananatis]